MTEDAAAQCRAYLLAHPDFLVQDPELLQELTLPHLGVGSASSLLERQIQRLREEREQLQRCVDHLLSQARRHTELAHHLSRFAVELLTAQDRDACLQALRRSLRDDFAVESLALLVAPDTTLPDALAIDEDSWQRLGGMARAQAGLLLSEAEMAHFFPTPEEPLASFASIRLEARACRGLVLLASVDPERYSADMGTDILEQISLLASAALERCSIAFPAAHAE